MPVVFYSFYGSDNETIPETSAREHLLGRKLLAEGLKQLYGIDTDTENIDSILYLSDKGKPALSSYPDIFFNITHCSGLAACAFDRNPVGIDAELPGYFAEVLINKALAENEKQFFYERAATPELKEEWFYRFWTLKEAFVKKTGTGVDTDLTAFSFSFSDAGIICSDPDVCCYQEQLREGHIISVCCSRPNDDVSFINIQIPV